MLKLQQIEQMKQNEAIEKEPWELKQARIQRRIREIKEMELKEEPRKADVEAFTPEVFCGMVGINWSLVQNGQ